MVLDIEKICRRRPPPRRPPHIDNTCATPINCQPFSGGPHCDPFHHQYIRTRYQRGGGDCDSAGLTGNKYADKFPGLTTPDASYPALPIPSALGLGSVYHQGRGAAYARFLAAVAPPMNAFLLNIGLENTASAYTPPLRQRQQVRSLRAAILKSSGHYPDLPGDKSYELAKKYLPNGSCAWFLWREGRTRRPNGLWRG